MTAVTGSSLRSQREVTTAACVVCVGSHLTITVLVSWQSAPDLATLSYAEFCVPCSHDHAGINGCVSALLRGHSTYPLTCSTGRPLQCALFPSVYGPHGFRMHVSRPARLQHHAADFRFQSFCKLCLLSTSEVSTHSSLPSSGLTSHLALSVSFSGFYVWQWVSLSQSCHCGRYASSNSCTLRMPNAYTVRLHFRSYG